MNRPDPFDYEAQLGDGAGFLTPTPAGPGAVVTAPGGFVGTQAQLLEKKASENIGQVGGRRRAHKTRRRQARKNRGILKRRYGRTRGAARRRRVQFTA